MCCYCICYRKQFKNKISNSMSLSGKRPYKSVETLKQNLLELLSPETFAESDEQGAIADEEFMEGVNQILAKFNSGSAQLQDEVPVQRQEPDVMDEGSDASSALTPKIQVRQDDFVATLWDVEGVGKGWYLGMVTRVIPASDCETCKERGLGMLSSFGPCFMIRCLEQMPTSAKGHYKWTAGFDDWHCIYPMLITKVTVIPVRRGHYSLEEPSSQVLDELLKATSELFDESSTSA